jgi:DNA polymerase III delta prime subunit
MELIGTSSLWVEKFRPKTLDDYICDDNTRTLIRTIIDSKEVPCFLLEGIGGSGKTSLAYVIANELDMDLLYINGSLETSVDTIRYKVHQFVQTSSMMGGKKLVVIDELDRMSVQAQESLKVEQEQSERNARFIFCTNNAHKIIQPLHSRTQLISFGKEMSQELLLQTFKRVKFILMNEGIEFDKAVLAELVQTYFPDMRKLINELQKAAMMYGKIDGQAMFSGDDGQVQNLITEMKAKKFNSIRKICSELDTATFYTTFYTTIVDHVDVTCLPDIILELADYAWKDTITLDKEINLTACVISILKVAKFK